MRELDSIPWIDIWPRSSYPNTKQTKQLTQYFLSLLLNSHLYISTQTLRPSLSQLLPLGRHPCQSQGRSQRLLLIHMAHPPSLVFGTSKSPMEQFPQLSRSTGWNQKAFTLTLVLGTILPFDNRWLRRRCRLCYLG